MTAECPARSRCAAHRALELLAAYADRERVDTALAELLTEVAGDARAQAGVELARQVSNSLAEHERRQRELAALYETAGDLSSLRDLEQVLTAIVARARALLGTDATYLMLIDEARGDTYVRVTDGIRTNAFKAARLAMGAGLGGLVAQTRRPYATPDYPHDTRFRHTVDDIVNGEGLVAVLGVPLLLRGAIIGVLFAANRRERPFDDAEVALLISLATHAAIAIETASLFADVRAHGELIERAAVAHERLTALVAQGGQLPDVAAVGAAALHATLVVVDPDLHVLAAAHRDHGEGAGGEVPVTGGRVPDGGWSTACREAVDRRVTVVAPHGYATPVLAGSRVLAVLLLAGRTALPDPDLRTLERAALVCAIVLLTEQAVAEAEHRVRGELLDDLFAEAQPDAEGLRRRARLLGLDLDREHVVVVAEPAGEDRRSVRSALTGWAREAGGVCGEHERAVVAVVPQPDARAVADQAADRARRVADLPVTIGADGPAAGAAGLRQSYRDARHCVRVLHALQRAGQAACPADLGAYALLFGPAGATRVAAFVRHRLGPVLDYDAERGSELLRTAEEYFACDGNLSRAATRLFIHVNTLYQRIERIGALLGDGWRSGDSALQLHLAIKLYRITGGAPAPAAGSS